MMWRSFWRTALAITLTTLSWQAWGFDLDDLQAQLQSANVVRGNFIQEKFLRSLPQPLTSQGTFTLLAGQGLLWRVQIPIAIDMRITAEGIARRGGAPRDGARRDVNDTWQALPAKSSSGRETRLFLAVLAGDTQGLKDNFDIVIEGESQTWKLALTPRSALLRQVFDRIEISGGQLVNTIEMIETQGDRSVLRMMDAKAATHISDEERRDFAN
ncbi:outer membrane lipoprotein carrier protein LolA [Pollutimonas nitritireducens]|uniref:outer membrane lipoprotein carrier protein LolA n=1 Tax=Pollutimonas nitritireducens TaxID=2045209 RepID=UPI001E5D8267|nr:outer membrane lipoprotein carrier protein LolA [Pollutimonas nitritireducens]